MFALAGRLFLSVCAVDARRDREIVARSSLFRCESVHCRFFFLCRPDFGRSEEGSLADVAPFRLSGVARRNGSLSAYLLGAIC